MHCRIPSSIFPRSDSPTFSENPSNHTGYSFFCKLIASGLAISALSRVSWEMNATGFSPMECCFANCGPRHRRCMELRVATTADETQGPANHRTSERDSFRQIVSFVCCLALCNPHSMRCSRTASKALTETRGASWNIPRRHLILMLRCRKPRVRDAAKHLLPICKWSSNSQLPMPEATTAILLLKPTSLCFNTNRAY